MRVGEKKKDRKKEKKRKKIENIILTSQNALSKTLYL